MNLKVIQFNGKLVNYKSTLQLQQKLVTQKLLNRSTEPDYLIICEHEPCITVGRRCLTELDKLKTSYPIIQVN